MNKLATLLLIFSLAISSGSFSQDIKPSRFDKRGITAIEGFMRAILDNAQDIGAAAGAAMPYIHPSEFSSDGKGLLPDRMNFSFRKAWQNARFYEMPVRVTRVQRQQLTGIGFGPTAEAGVSYKVWIAKSPGINGMPAPLSVFFPADGSDPRLHGYGSL